MCFGDTYAPVDREDLQPDVLERERSSSERVVVEREAARPTSAAVRWSWRAQDEAR